MSKSVGKRFSNSKIELNAQIKNPYEDKYKEARKKAFNALSKNDCDQYKKNRLKSFEIAIKYEMWNCENNREQK